MFVQNTKHTQNIFAPINELIYGERDGGWYAAMYDRIWNTQTTLKPTTKVLLYRNEIMNRKSTMIPCIYFGLLRLSFYQC